MELGTVREIAPLVNKTESMIYYLLNVKKIFTKYPTGTPGNSAGPAYRIDKNEVIDYFKNKEPRKDYSNFLYTASLTVDGEEYVSSRKAADMTGVPLRRVEYLAKKHSIRTTPIVTSKRGDTVHFLLCLPEITRVLEIELKIMELKESLIRATEKGA